MDVETGDPSPRLVLSLLVSMRVGSLGMLVREFAMFLGGRCMMLRLLVLAAHVVMIRLVVVMRSGVMVTGRGVVMLRRRMFCHLSVLPLVRIGTDLSSTVQHSPLVEE
jgi:hypothetical protein